MSCVSCAYYDEGARCKLYGVLGSLDCWTDCAEYIYCGGKLVVGPCCGIYNYPELRPAKPHPSDSADSGVGSVIP